MFYKLKRLLVSVASLALHFTGYSQNKIVVFQSDFGLADGAVSAMKGVALGVSTDLKLFDLTHDIPAYDIWEAAYRLEQTVAYWPAGTVFVSVVDPGVGTKRRSVVLKTKSGHYIVTPDNGTLTLIAESLKIDTLREIDESTNRRSGSGQSYTFHGRDVYAFTAARLASGLIRFEDVGRMLPDSVVSLPYQEAIMNGNNILGNIPVLDVRFGNIWTNIGHDLLDQLQLNYGDSLRIKIFNNKKKIFEGIAPFTETFGAVAKGKPLAYLNSLMQLSFALNEGSFATVYHVSAGGKWRVMVTKKK